MHILSNDNAKVLLLWPAMDIKQGFNLIDDDDDKQIASINMGTKFIF